ncbi:MAG: hypothetical protein DHS20C13_01900 [Thermodesulfobacteriota bacterium]|nr:MAG: hypothetical protein DHS20C13_01900 [Thermodesulfobacteriota bacterium]
MTRYNKGVAALSVLAVLLLVGAFLFNPLGETVDAKQDSKVSNKSPLPKALVPVVAKSLSKDDSSYHINSTKDLHTANTPRHGLETRFEKNSATFKSGSDSFELSLDALGRGDQLNPVASVSGVKAIDNRLEYIRGDVTEWYVNSLLGMEQGFTLSQRPEGKSEQVNILLGLNTEGDLNAKDSENGKSIIFTDSSDNEVMSYSKLYVYDAEGKELESTMKLSDKGIVIAFNDTEATYPVVVDPLVEVQRILASNGNDNDLFGACSAVYDMFAVVGAPDKGRGFAYIFERDMAGVWNEVIVLRGQDFGASSGAEFGAACDIAATENFGPGVTAFAVIGAPEDDLGAGSDHGAGYVFERDGSGTWTFEQEISASPRQTEADFGFDVAITEEGYIIAGAPDDNFGLNCPPFFFSNADKGRAYIYERNGSWPATQTQRIQSAVPFCDDNFGEGVGIDGSFAMVGAPGTTKVIPNFPFFLTDAGAVYAFERDGTWSQNGTRIIPSQVDADDEFGDHVDVYTGDSGTRAIVGAPEASFGGDEGAGEAYILERTGGSPPNWDSNIQRLRAPVEFRGEEFEFGSCVGIWGDYAIVGAEDEDIDGDNAVGASYIFGLDEGSWVFEQRLLASDPGANDKFGTSCDIDDLMLSMVYSPVAIVGAEDNDIDGENDQGAAYLFEQEQTGTITIAKQTIPDGFVADFDFEGIGFEPGNECESFTLSDDGEQECGEQDAGTYTINETVTNDSEVIVTCDSGDWEQVDDGVVIELVGGDDITCTFTNTLPLELGPILPGVKNNVNTMTVAQATPGGQVAFVWGFGLGTTIIGGPICNGIELGINPLEFLGFVNADGAGIAEFLFFVPSLGNNALAYTQAVDIDTCRASEVVENLLSGN